LRLEQRRRALEVGPAERIRRALEHLRRLHQRARAARLITQHERDTGQLRRTRTHRRQQARRRHERRCGGKAQQATPLGRLRKKKGRHGTSLTT